MKQEKNENVFARQPELQLGAPVQRIDKHNSETDDTEGRNFLCPNNANIFYTNNFLNSEEEIKKYGGRITHKFSDNVIIANLPFIDVELKDTL